jgi:hypothetical protein
MKRITRDNKYENGESGGTKYENGQPFDGCGSVARTPQAVLLNFSTCTVGKLSKINFHDK